MMPAIPFKDFSIIHAHVHDFGNVDHSATVVAHKGKCIIAVDGELANGFHHKHVAGLGRSGAVPNRRELVDWLAHGGLCRAG